MTLTFTEQDLIRYHYGEANHEESQAIQSELERNLNFRLQYERLKFVWDQLDQFKMNPSEETISSILDASASHLSNVEPLD